MIKQYFYDFPHIMVNNSKTVRNRENLTGNFLKLIKFPIKKVSFKGMRISINVHWAEILELKSKTFGILLVLLYFFVYNSKRVKKSCKQKEIFRNLNKFSSREVNIRISINVYWAEILELKGKIFGILRVLHHIFAFNSKTVKKSCKRKVIFRSLIKFP